MNKFIKYAIPTAALSIFIVLMLSVNLLKMPLGNNDNLPNAIEKIVEDVNSERWEDAAHDTDELNVIWGKIVNRVQFCAERDEINYFSMCIARLKGAILAKDKSSALMQLYEAHEHWDNLGR